MTLESFLQISPFQLQHLYILKHGVHLGDLQGSKYTALLFALHNYYGVIYIYYEATENKTVDAFEDLSRLEPFFPDVDISKLVKSF